MKSKPIIWLVIVLVLAGVLFACLKLSPAPNVELKKTNQMTVETLAPSAKAIVEAALSAIQARNAKKLMAVMSNHDEVMLETYTEELFKGGDFAPAEIKGARAVEKSTQGGLAVIVHSTPRNKDYVFNLIQRNGKYAVKGIR